MQGTSATDNMTGFDFDSEWRPLTYPDNYPTPRC